MKKTILVSLLICFALSLSAQSVVGKWQAEKVEEEGQKIKMELIFTPQHTLFMNVILNMYQPEAIDMIFHLNLNGTYSEGDGKNMPFTLNTENADIAFDKMEFLGEMAEKLKDNEEMKEGLRKLMQKQINDQKGEMLKDIPTEGTLTIKEITANTMKLMMGDDEDDVLDLKRVE